MDSKIKNIFKLLSINIIFFFVFILIFELFFGHWFEKYNFGPYMREHRFKKNPYLMTYNNKNYNYIYERNSLAFRGKEINPKNIKIIMVGGSTTDERYKPEELTIVGKLNKKLLEVGYQKKIINAGVEGQSTFGHIHNFKYWFSRIKNFNPDNIIFYIGVNDTRILKDGNLQDGWLMNPNKFEQLIDNIKSRSFIADKFKKIKHKFHKKSKRIIYDYDYSMKVRKDKLFYLNFEEKEKIYDNQVVINRNRKMVKKYLKNIDILYDLTKSMNAEPIFINQVMHQDKYAEVLFALNRSLINHCKKENYKCIDLAKDLEVKDDFWWDGVHTTPKGSEAIANEILPKLVKFLN